MKARQLILLSGILLFFAGSVVVLHKLSTALQEKKELYATLPAFRLPALTGEIVSDTTIDRHKATVFYFFDPDCNLCHTMLEHLKTKQETFAGSQILLVTLLPEEKIKDFLAEIDFSLPENIKILLDEDADLMSLMEIKGIPASLIYRDAILIKRFDGPVTIETLIKYLQ